MLTSEEYYQEDFDYVGNPAISRALNDSTGENDDVEDVCYSRDLLDLEREVVAQLSAQGVLKPYFSTPKIDTPTNDNNNDETSHNRNEVGVYEKLLSLVDAPKIEVKSNKRGINRSKSFQEEVNDKQITPQWISCNEDQFVFEDVIEANNLFESESRTDKNFDQCLIESGYENKKSKPVNSFCCAMM